MENIFGFVFSMIVLGSCAVLMLGIGISQCRSTKPVGFYSGETPPKPEQLTDVPAWNRKHGTMWIIYGCCIAASWVWVQFIGDSILVLVPYCVGLILPIPLMIFYHTKLIQKYKIK